MEEWVKSNQRSPRKKTKERQSAKMSWIATRKMAGPAIKTQPANAFKINAKQKPLTIARMTMYAF